MPHTSKQKRSAYCADRRRNTNERYRLSCELPATRSISDNLFSHFNLAAGIGALSGDKPALIKWGSKQPAAIRDEIIFFGVMAIAARCRARAKYGPGGVVSQGKKAAIKHAARTEKARAFDRIIALLDAMYVGNKLLGDCTASDLKRAAVEAQRIAGEWDVKAAFYRELASLVGNQTVREAADRGKIVALLTTTFRPEGENAIGSHDVVGQVVRG